MWSAKLLQHKIVKLVIKMKSLFFLLLYSIKLELSMFSFQCKTDQSADSLAITTVRSNVAQRSKFSESLSIHSNENICSMHTIESFHVQKWLIWNLIFVFNLQTKSIDTISHRVISVESVQRVRSRESGPIHYSIEIDSTPAACPIIKHSKWTK